MSADDLKEPYKQHCEADGPQDPGVVVQQGLLAASPPQVQPLALLVVVSVGCGVAEIVLDAGSGGQGAATAEGNAVHQVLPLHVTPHTAAEKKRYPSVTTLKLWKQSQNVQKKMRLAYAKGPIQKDH